MIGQLEEFEKKFGSPGRALSRLIRPAIAADEAHTLVWGDWSAIEARVLPWLADTRGARGVLDVFEASDADRDQPDLYMIEASHLLKMDPHEMWARYREGDPEASGWRQRGKVPVLSLGYGGGVGALQAMATGYRMSISEAEAQIVVDVWRENNRWARGFWDALWKAFLAAMESPGTVHSVGRVAYHYDEGYLNGSMLCFLPDGRPLIYPTLRWEKREREDREGNTTTRTELTYRRGYQRRSLWYGVLAENITQATAGSLLRECLVRLCPPDGTRGELSIADVIGHTHDEIIAETLDNPDAIAATRAELQAAMEAPTAWSEGLPLVAEVSDNFYYSKVHD